MNKTNILSIIGLVALLFASSETVKAQPPVPPGGISGITNIIGQIDESTNLFTSSEFEIRLGGVYVQSEDRAAEVLAASYWGLLDGKLGIGAELISLNAKSAAAFPYVEYRKTLGNVAGGIFLGGGYDFDINKPMGVSGLRLYLRTSKHLGIWSSVAYEFSDKAHDRGLITGAGVSYSF